MNILFKENNIIKKIVSQLFKHNYSLFFCNMFGFLPNKFITLHYYTLMVFDDVKPTGKVSENYIFSWANESDLVNISELLSRPLDVLQDRLSSGDICYIIRDKLFDNKLVHARWVHLGPCFIKGLGYKLTIDDNSAYIYWACTHQDARANGLSSASVYNISVYLKQLNVNKIYGLVDNCNIRSYNHHINCKSRSVKLVQKIWFANTFILNILATYNNDKNKFSITLKTGAPAHYPII